MITSCPDCGETKLSWADQRFGHCRRVAPIARVKRNRQKRARKPSGYASDLARFPNDPQARIGDSKAARTKLEDQRLREGWVEAGTVRDLKENVRKTAEELYPSRGLFQKTVEEAKEALHKGTVKQYLEGLDRGC